MIKNFFTTAAYGKNYSAKSYDLDAIILVGYRVKSRVATQFRIWATQRVARRFCRHCLQNCGLSSAVASPRNPCAT